MAYKMKGPSMYKDKLTVNRNGYNGTPEGRAKSSMAQYNKKGAPNYKNPQDYKVFNMGNKPEADEFSGAPMLKGNQHKIDKNKDGKISKADFDMMNKKGAPKYKSDAQRKAVHASKADGGKGAPKRKDEKRLDRYNKRNEKNRAFYEKRKDEFRKDSEGVLRDKRGTSVKDRRAEYNAQMRDKAKYETKKPGAPGLKDVVKKVKKVGRKVKNELKAISKGIGGMKGRNVQMETREAIDSYKQEKARQKRAREARQRAKRGEGSMKELNASVQKPKNVATTKKGVMESVKKMKRKKAVQNYKK